MRYAGIEGFLALRSVKWLASWKRNETLQICVSSDGAFRAVLYGIVWDIDLTG